MAARAPRHDEGVDRAPPEGRSQARPVLLVTLECPFDAQAESVAVTAALEAGADLFLIDLVDIAGLPSGFLRGHNPTLATREERQAIRDSAARASALGVHAEILHARTPRPPQALRELVGELRPGLLVLGPSRLARGRRARRVVEAARDETRCLVFLADSTQC